MAPSSVCSLDDIGHVHRQQCHRYHALIICKCCGVRLLDQVSCYFPYLDNGVQKYSRPSNLYDTQYLWTQLPFMVMNVTCFCYQILLRELTIYVDIWLIHSLLQSDTRRSDSANGTGKKRKRDLSGPKKGVCQFVKLRQALRLAFDVNLYCFVHVDWWRFDVDYVLHST